MLTPDFKGDREALRAVLEAEPEVFNHNIETVPRLFPRLRPQGRYRLSLDVLARGEGDCGPAQATKSGLMVGLGETDDEIAPVLARPARGRRRHRDDRPVPAPDARARAGRTAT